MLAIILSVLLLVLFYIKITTTYKYWTNKGVKQGRPVYLLGDVARHILKKESVYDTVMGLYNLHPNERYMGVYQTMLPVLLIRDAELIKQIGVKGFEHFVDHRPLIPEGTDPMWSQNLLALQGDRWRQMRPTLSPSFTSSKMKIIFNLITECAEHYLQYFTKTNDATSVELKDIFTRYTNDVIATVVCGIKCDSINYKTNDFYLMGKRATTITFWKKFTIFSYTMLPALCKALGVRFFEKSESNFFEKLITGNIKMREEQGIVRQDMIHLLLEARKGNKVSGGQTNKDAGFAAVTEMLKEDESKRCYITDIDIAAQALVFFFAGFETVSILMCFMGYELALNPDIQKKLQEEIDYTVKRCNGKLTYEALVTMKYMDMVVTETLRKWPPIALTDRVCTKSYTIEPTSADEKPITLRPGDVVWIPICPIHRDPKNYQNPEKFDPERFSDENKNRVKSDTFLPFGLGPRNCIGSRMALLEVKTIFFHILQKLDFVVTERTEIPLTLGKTTFNLSAENGMWMDLKPRKIRN